MTLHNICVYKPEGEYICVLDSYCKTECFFSMGSISEGATILCTLSKSNFPFKVDK